MNGRREANKALVDGILAQTDTAPGVELLVCPPYPYLSEVSSALAGGSVALGAQSVSEHSSGAFTGEVEADMLSECGVRYVLVGHSERRSLFGESNADVAAKFKAASNAGLTPVLCVGETLEQREAGETRDVVSQQIDAVLDLCGISAFDGAVIAYEPVWAIGTGKTATPEMAEEVHAQIRQQISAHDAKIAQETRILYGGSMKAANADGLLSQANIDGGLIGGASLAADDFMAIAVAASRQAN